MPTTAGFVQEPKGLCQLRRNARKEQGPPADRVAPPDAGVVTEDRSSDPAATVDNSRCFARGVLLLPLGSARGSTALRAGVLTRRKSGVRVPQRPQPLRGNGSRVSGTPNPRSTALEEPITRCTCVISQDSGRLSRATAPVVATGNRRLRLRMRVGTVGESDGRRAVRGALHERRRDRATNH